MKISAIKHAVTIIAVVGYATATVTVAEAHAKLTASNPPAGAVVVEPPKELRLTFNETLIAKFSGAELMVKDGKKVETAAAAIDPADKKQLVVPLPAALADGVYSVKWHAVSEDTHPLEGTYSFTVKH